jgi:uncharacterized repeat protein (TIGR03837 family)
MLERRRWDIFGKVVDNFGDAGVGWRLARQLASEHAQDVTLWQDDLATLARIAPGVDPHKDVQSAAGVTVRRWNEPLADPRPADVVVEAFGCGLPPAYVAAMARARPAPAWLILEYLSAETWVDGAHGLTSPHPQFSLPRRFFFPGFTAKTGGLIRERGLLDARDAFCRDSAAQQELWSALGVPAPAATQSAFRSSAIPIPCCPRFSTRGPTATKPSCASCPTVSLRARSICGLPATCRTPATRCIGAA